MVGITSNFCEWKNIREKVVIEWVAEKTTEKPNTIEKNLVLISILKLGVEQNFVF